MGKGYDEERKKAHEKMLNFTYKKMEVEIT